MTDIIEFFKTLTPKQIAGIIIGLFVILYLFNFRNSFVALLLPLAFLIIGYKTFKP